MSELSKKEVILSRMSYYKSIISKTILAIQNYRMMDVLTYNDLNLGISNLEKNNELIQSLDMMLKNDDIITEEHINILQEINDNLSIVCKNYGTEKMDDILNELEKDE